MNRLDDEPELDGRFLGSISSDFIKICDFLKEASYQMRSRKISDFPIFPMSRSEVPVGQLIISPLTHQTTWYYNISLLEEFLDRDLVEPEKLEVFKQAYKDADEFCCLFVVDPQITGFVYIPYPED
jgi:hypothetical protein